MGISRVSTISTADTMLNYIMSAESKYNHLSEEAASGIKVAKPSDDPTATKSILTMNSKMDELNQYLSNMKSNQSELNTVDSTLASLTNLVQDASGYATQAANGTYNSDDLKNIKSQVDQMIENIVNLANTNYNGKYVFSGTATSTETYSITKNVSGNITAITYNGTSSSEYERYVNISDGVSIAINVRGSDVFGSYTAAIPDNPATTGVDESAPEVATGILGHLVQLSNALSTANTTTINSCIGNLDSDLDTTTATRTKLSAISNRFDMTSDNIDKTITNLKSYRSDLQDADLTEVLTDLTTSQNALKASYSVTSKMLTANTLLDYL